MVLSAVSDKPTRRLFRADLCKCWDSVSFSFVEILEINDGQHAVERHACALNIFGCAAIYKAISFQRHLPCQPATL